MSCVCVSNEGVVTYSKKVNCLESCFTGINRNVNLKKIYHKTTFNRLHAIGRSRTFHHAFVDTMEHRTVHIRKMSQMCVLHCVSCQLLNTWHKLFLCLAVFLESGLPNSPHRLKFGWCACLSLKDVCIHCNQR